MDCQNFEGQTSNCRGEAFRRERASNNLFRVVLLAAIGLSTAFGALDFSASCPALAQTPAPSPDAGRADPMNIYREAGVSAEQEGKIRELVKAFETEATGRIDGLRKAMKEMRDLSLQPQPDEAAVLAKQDEINKIQNDISTGRIKLLLKIRASLSKEQKQKLVDLMQHSAQGNQ